MAKGNGQTFGDGSIEHGVNAGGSGVMSELDSQSTRPDWTKNNDRIV
jgi:hypothetical protein